MRRRTFLQQAGWIAAALGMSEIGLFQRCDRFAQALAQPTRRKLALLVGINQAAKNPGLTGCVTDTELQRELLIHRFGFLPADILTLTDQQATHDNLVTAFLAHLTQQTQPGDVVVFHFSGYGGRVSPQASWQLTEQRAPSASFWEGVQNSLVMADSGLPSAKGLGVNDLPEEMLLLLLRSLATDQITTILDTSYLPLASTSALGSLRLRARPGLIGELSAEAIASQEHLLAQIRVSRDHIAVQRRAGQVPGLVISLGGIGSTTPILNPNSGAKAWERQWTGFSAGLLTYALTQHLWQTLPATTVQITLQQTANRLSQWVGQSEQAAIQGQTGRAIIVPFLETTTVEGTVIGADAEGKTAQIWLAGLPATVLEQYGLNSLFQLLPPTGFELPAQYLQITSREGLTAKGRLWDEGGQSQAIAVGQGIQEVVRVLPKSVNLVVGLDPELKRIERVDATSAFAGLAGITSAIAPEQASDCFFGRVSTLNRPSPIADSTKPDTPTSLAKTNAPDGAGLPPAANYGLFSLSRELIAGTQIEAGEAVKTAVNRLVPQMQHLLALKWLRLLDNEASSRLGVRIRLEKLTPEPQLLTQRLTQRGLSAEETAIAPGPVVLPVGSRLRAQVMNLSDRPLYFMLLSTGGQASSTRDSALKILTLPDSNGSARTWQTAIAPQETLTFPAGGNIWDWTIQDPKGLTELYFLWSIEPFQRTLAVLETTNRTSSSNPGFTPLSQPLDILQALVQDLHQASTSLSPLPNVTPDFFALHVQAWASLSVLYQSL